MPDWTKIRKEWEAGGITMAALAKKHKVKLGTIKSRKSREAWGTEPDATQKDATTEKVATLQVDATEPEPVIENEKLTEKQKRFCLFYIKSFNATQAAIKAGYSKDTARVQGPRMLRNVAIADEIRRLKGNSDHQLFADAMDVVRMHLAIAFADITDFVTFKKVEKPLIDPITGLPEKYKNGDIKMHTYNAVDFVDSEMIDGTIVSEVKQGRDGVSVKLADRGKSLEFLAKYFDILPDDFQRQLEIEKLKLQRERLHGVEVNEEMQDDGFLDALNKKTKEVWADDQ